MSSVRKPESHWQRLLRSLLYGLDVNRNAKAKARLGLAIVAFAVVYGVIAARLVMFAAQSDGHGTGRRLPHARQRTSGCGRPCAARYPRPQWTDSRYRREDAIAVRRAAQAN